MNMKRNAFIALIAVILLSGCPVLNTGKHPGKSGDGGTYTVSFSVNGGKGTPPADRKVTAGSGITLPDGEGLSKNGFNFGGWNTKADGTGERHDAGTEYTPTGNITLYAEWDTVYTVTFNGNGGVGTAPTAEKVVPGESVTLPDGEGLSKVGFNFGGWNTKADGTGDNYKAGDEYTPESSITLYAQWLVLYTVTFDINGGTGTPPSARTINAGSRIQLSSYQIDFTKDGFIFGCWNTQADGMGSNYGGSHDEFFTPTGSITLYAQWTQQDAVYTISYNLNGGSGTTPNSQTVNTSDWMRPPSGSGLSKTGYVFSGWNTKTDGTGNNYIYNFIYKAYDFSGSITLYAKWLAAYTVTYNANGGEGTVPPAETNVIGKRIKLPYGGGLTKAGFVYAGWNTNAAGTGSNYDAGAYYTPSGNVTLYARWTVPAVSGDFGFLEEAANCTLISYSGNGGAVSIPATYNGKPVVAIATNAFANNTDITSVSIPDSVTSIGPQAFISCTNLASVTLPSSLTYIGERAFYQCALTSVNLPYGLETIAYMAFYGCEALAGNLSIPNSVTFIGGMAFYGCSSLSSVTIPGGADLDIANSSGGTFNGCTSLKSVIIENGVPHIGSNMFAYCTSLTSVTLPASVINIGNGGEAFSHCTSLTEVTILGVLDTGIGGATFYQSSNITKVFIQGTTATISGGAFPQSLSRITIGSDIVPDLFENGCIYGYASFKEVYTGAGTYVRTFAGDYSTTTWAKE